MFTSETLFFLICFLLVISAHEAAHAYVAFKFGDPTAKLEGRLTLNPLAHLDIFGTLALIFVHIGWAKPVPVNPNNLRHPSRDNFIIAISGPAANLLMALAGALVYLGVRSIPVLGPLFLVFIELNIVLMIFNLLPIPPLDGSKIWHLILSNESYYTLEQMGPYILLAVIVFSFSTGNILFSYLFQAADALTRFIT